MGVRWGRSSGQGASSRKKRKHTNSIRSLALVGKSSAGVSGDHGGSLTEEIWNLAPVNASVSRSGLHSDLRTQTLRSTG